MKLKLFPRCAAVLVLAATALAQTPNAPTMAGAQAPSSGGPHLLVLNKAENTLAIIEPETLKVVARVGVGEGPHEVVASRDGRTAYVANYGTQRTLGSTISVVDIAARRELKRVDLGALRRPHGIVEVGGKIYFTAEANRAVARYDPAADRVDWLVGTGQAGTHMLVVTPDQKRIYTANIGSHTVTSITLGAPPSPQNFIQIAVGKGPEGIDLSPDGKELWVAHRDDGGLSIIDTATNKIKETLAKFSEVPIRVKFTPDGKRVLVSDAKAGELIILDAATRKEIKRLKTEGAPVGILVTPDGRRAFVARTQSDNVAVVDLEKQELAGTIEPGEEPDGMAWATGAGKISSPPAPGRGGR